MGEEILKRQCGDWWLEREIGQGAYGVVYLAAGPCGERAAVKVCRREAVGDERYARELHGAKLYRAIPPQEGLVRMRKLVETEWGFYTVMDLADDEFASDSAASPGRAASPFAAASGEYRPKTLASVIDGEKALPLGECVKLGIALAGGLAALQRHHLLHRDIKPGNVIYVGGKPVLSDPGLIVEESEAVSLVGTPGYVPPEKFTDSASDIYSLGLTLKAASFGRKLEDLDKGPALEADTGSALFPAWWRILNKATDPDASRRYQSAKAFIKELNTLKRRMALATIFRTRIAKVAIALGAAVAVATVILAVSASRRLQIDLSEKYRLQELNTVNRKIKILDEQARGTTYTSLDLWFGVDKLSAADIDMIPELTPEERKRRDFFWEASAAGQSPYRAKYRAAEAQSKVERVLPINLAIPDIRAVDAVKADKLQSLYDNVVALSHHSKIT